MGKFESIVSVTVKLQDLSQTLAVEMTCTHHFRYILTVYIEEIHRTHNSV